MRRAGGTRRLATSESIFTVQAFLNAQGADGEERAPSRRWSIGRQQAGQLPVEQGVPGGRCVASSSEGALVGTERS